MLTIIIPEWWNTYYADLNNHQGPHHPKAHQLVMTENPLCSARCLHPEQAQEIHIILAVNYCRRDSSC